MVDDFEKEINLPNIIPIFPLVGVVMFPDTYLPLNIFETRYLKMVDNAISNKNRLIGMIQPKNLNKSDEKSAFYRVGCAGKIIKFEETDDNRYLITLKGLSRFILISEKTNEKDYKEANISWENFSKDLNINAKSSDFSTLKKTLKKYFKLKNPSPYMLLVAKVINPKLIPSVTHIDGTARVQTINKLSLIHI